MRQAESEIPYWPLTLKVKHPERRGEMHKPKRVALYLRESAPAYRIRRPREGNSKGIRKKSGLGRDKNLRGQKFGCDQLAPSPRSVNGGWAEEKIGCRFLCGALTDGCPEPASSHYSHGRV